ncbi:hypothetical protein P349_04893 [Enterobacter sp. DC4]|nr:hypothetical protein P349_04893 [Enterobacter sp. DC4]
MAIWSGVVAYILRLQQGHIKPSCLRMLGQVVVSCFTGVIGGLIALDEKFSVPIIFCVAGLAGASGTALLHLLQQKLMQRLQDYIPPKAGGENDKPIFRDYKKKPK